jgi:hypothetical protein
MESESHLFRDPHQPDFVSGSTRTARFRLFTFSGVSEDPLARKIYFTCVFSWARFGHTIERFGLTWLRNAQVTPGSVTAYREPGRAVE